MQKMDNESHLFVFVTHPLYEDLDKGRGRIWLAVDFKKASDRVNHSLLLSKVALTGVGGKTHLGFQSYLSGRIQCMVVGEFRSIAGKVISGASEGSILGPLLCLILINDLLSSHVPPTSSSFFADDVFLISTQENGQKSVKELADWTKCR
jgi:hypothetical protein